MKTRKIIGGLLGCLMLCGILVGCSGNDSNSNPNSNYRKGTVTESKFTSEWMEIQYTLPSDMTMLSEETIASGSKDNIQVEMQAYLTDAPSTKNIGMLAEDVSKDTSIDENKYIELTKTQMEKAIPDITFGEQGKRTIAEQEFYELPYSYTRDVDGTQTTVTQTFLCKKKEDRMVCITLTYPDQETLDHLLSGFSPLNQTTSQ
ncbi:MAG: hypothetical protein KHX91_05350 [Clostridium sp.]|nr:hypothetical protein [Clostridium sp.]